MIPSSVLILCLSLSYISWAEAAAVPSSEAPIIEIEQGKVKGEALKSRQGRPYYGYRQIPYGSAPRFEVI